MGVGDGEDRLDVLWFECGGNGLVACQIRVEEEQRDGRMRGEQEERREEEIKDTRKRKGKEGVKKKEGGHNSSNKNAHAPCL